MSTTASEPVTNPLYRACELLCIPTRAKEDCDLSVSARQPFSRTEIMNDVPNRHGHPKCLLVRYNPSADCYRVYWHGTDSHTLEPQWLVYRDSTMRRVTTASGLTEFRSGAPSWTLELVCSALPLYWCDEIPYRYYDPNTGAATPFVVTHLAHGELSVLPSDQISPAALRGLNAGKFWSLYCQGTLRPTDRELVGVGWLWQDKPPKRAASSATTGGLVGRPVLWDNQRRTLRHRYRFGRTDIRQPLQLNQIDSMACFTSVIANIRWMYGTSELTGPEAVEEVDQLTRRRAERPSSVSPQLELLLDEGYEIIEYHTWDSQRFLKEGVEYLKEYNGRHWQESNADYWTPERLQLAARRSAIIGRRFRRIHEHHPRGRYRLFREKPRLRDIRRLVNAQAGYVALPALDNGSPDTNHASLVFDCDSAGFAVYNPNTHGPTLYHYSPQRFNNEWLPQEIIFVRRPRGQS